MLRKCVVCGNRFWFKHKCFRFNPDVALSEPALPPDPYTNDLRAKSLERDREDDSMGLLNPLNPFSPLSPISPFSIYSHDRHDQPLPAMPDNPNSDSHDTDTFASQSSDFVSSDFGSSDFGGGGGSSD